MSPFRKSVNEVKSKLRHSTILSKDRLKLRPWIVCWTICSGKVGMIKITKRGIVTKMKKRNRHSNERKRPECSIGSMVEDTREENKDESNNGNNNGNK